MRHFQMRPVPAEPLARRTGSLAGLLRAAPLILATLWTAPASLSAQTARSPEPSSTVMAAAGLGTSAGGAGLQIQVDVLPQRLSAFIGGGYNPSVSGRRIGGAAGMRLFAGPAEDRGFLEFAFAPIMLEEARSIPGGVFPRTVYDQYYGPAVSLGLQRVFDSGVTVLIAYGVGYAIGVPDERAPVARTIGVGIGYTWR